MKNMHSNEINEFINLQSNLSGFSLIHEGFQACINVSVKTSVVHLSHFSA